MSLRRLEARLQAKGLDDLLGGAREERRVSWNGDLDACQRHRQPGSRR